ncbi:hypothetical protein [Sphingobacterium thalpophilum]|uniref:hypothetical protein n=1 Tax=Sphingobacterium thalpophilum TaxID=259 RepID=UPI0024A72A78|nr:hypothetical protein [Sphingobacterium thalpophilum]
MKAVIAIICFISFLLIRSGNSHVVRNDSDRPAISFMYQHGDDQHKDKIASAVYLDSRTEGNLPTENPLIEDFDSENFQLTRNLQMASDFVTLVFFAVVLFIFVFRYAKKIPFCNFSAYLHPHLYLLQRNWRI